MACSSAGLVVTRWWWQIQNLHLNRVFPSVIRHRTLSFHPSLSLHLLLDQLSSPILNIALFKLQRTTAEENLSLFFPSSSSYSLTRTYPPPPSPPMAFLLFFYFIQHKCNSSACPDTRRLIWLQATVQTVYQQAAPRQRGLQELHLETKTKTGFFSTKWKWDMCL